MAGLPHGSAMRLRDYDGTARLALGGTAIAVLAFALPWVSVGQGLLREPLTGFGLIVLPALLARLQPGTGVDLAALAVAVLTAVSLVTALAASLLALAPAVRSASAHDPPAGFALSLAGLVAGLLAVGAMALLVGPRLGTLFVEYGSVLALASLALGALGWRRMPRAAEGPAAALGAAKAGSLPDGPR
jgi:hypothetical protein